MNSAFSFGYKKKRAAVEIVSILTPRSIIAAVTGIALLRNVAIVEEKAEQFGNDTQYGKNGRSTSNLRAKKNTQRVGVS